MSRIRNHKSSFYNMDANNVAMFAYATAALIGFTPVLYFVAFTVPLVLYATEKKSLFVKNHSLQAFIISFSATIMYLVFCLVSLLTKPWCNNDLTKCFGSSIIHKTFGMYGSMRWMIAGMVFIVCLVLALRAYNCEEYELNGINKIYKPVSKFLDKLLSVRPIHQENKEETKKEEKPTKTKKKTSTPKKTNNKKQSNKKAH